MLRTLSGLCLALTVLVGAGCGSTAYQFESSPIVPAAEGTVKISPGENDNTNVHVSVRHLAQPQKVNAFTTTYVVWARPSSGDRRPQNLGALTVDKDLNGELNTVTALHNFDVLITPEPTSQVTLPSNPPVLTLTVIRN